MNNKIDQVPDEFKQLADDFSKNGFITTSFDNLVNTGDPGSIQLAVDGLLSKYQNENGYEGRMLTGKPSKQSSDVFRSQAQLVEAMSDPRYDRDPAYRQDVIAKLDRSDLKF